MSDAQDIETKAAEWLMKRDAGEEGNPEFTAWLAAEPRHRAAYLRLAAAWESTRQLKRLRAEGSGVDPDLLAPRRSGFRPWRPLAFAAALALITVSALWWIGRTPGVQVYRTDVGGLSRVVLSDGSTVTLNTDTEVRVTFTRAKRGIELVRGEAEFQVAHDTRHPFEVQAGGRVVRAVGTAFDVYEKSTGTTVTVLEGRVAIIPFLPDGFATTSAHDAGAPPQAAGQTSESSSAPESSRPSVLVSAGESAVAEGSRVTVRRVSTTEASRRLAWEVGELSFQGETLKEAVAEFNRYNRRKLRVEDPTVATFQVGGNFQALDVDSFVAALQKSFGIRAKETAEGVELIGKQAEP